MKGNIFHLKIGYKREFGLSRCVITGLLRLTRMNEEQKRSQGVVNLGVAQGSFVKPVN